MDAVNGAHAFAGQGWEGGTPTQNARSRLGAFAIQAGSRIARVATWCPHDDEAHTGREEEEQRAHGGRVG